MPSALVTEDEVIALCAQSKPNTSGYCCVYPDVNPVYFIKYSGTMGEARTQEYVYHRTTDVPGAPRVPKVYHAFERDAQTYIIMEFINALTVDEFLAEHPSQAEHVHQSIASALSWLFHLPLPQHAGLGPVGGGLAVHRFFGDYDHTAPLEFADNLALQRYVNEALRHTPGRGVKMSVDFESEELRFYHSDIRKPNFLYSPGTGEIWLIDFQHVGIFPTSFASYALHALGDPFIRDMAARIDLPKSEHIPAMGRAAGILLRFGGSALGLNEQGLPKARGRQLDDQRISIFHRFDAQLEP